MIKNKFSMKLLFLLTALFYVFFISAQEDKDYLKNRLGFYYGRSAPQGAFAETNIDEESGFAVNGTVFTIAYQHFYKENSAVTFRYGRSKNGFASNSYAALLDEIANNDSLDWFADAEDYRVNYGLLGLKLVYGEKTKLYINPMAGVGSFTSPEIKIRTRTLSGLFIGQRVRKSDPSTEVMFGVAGGLDILLSKGVNLNFDLFYLVSEFRYTLVVDTYDAFGQPIDVEESGEQPYTTVNISIGLDFSF